MDLVGRTVQRKQKQRGDGPASNNRTSSSSSSSSSSSRLIAASQPEGASNEDVPMSDRDRTESNGSSDVQMRNNSQSEVKSRSNSSAPVSSSNSSAPVSSSSSSSAPETEKRKPKSSLKPTGSSGLRNGRPRIVTQDEVNANHLEELRSAIPPSSGSDPNYATFVAQLQQEFPAQVFRQDRIDMLFEIRKITGKAWPVVARMYLHADSRPAADVDTVVNQGNFRSTTEEFAAFIYEKEWLSRHKTRLEEISALANREVSEIKRVKQAEDDGRPLTLRQRRLLANEDLAEIVTSPPVEQTLRRPTSLVTNRIDRDAAARIREINEQLEGVRLTKQKRKLKEQKKEIREEALTDRTAAILGVDSKAVHVPEQIMITNTTGIQSLVFQNILRWMPDWFVDEKGFAKYLHLHAWDPFVGPFGPDGPLPFDTDYGEKMEIILLEPNDDPSKPYVPRKIDELQAIAMMDWSVIAMLNRIGLFEPEPGDILEFWVGFYYMNVYRGGSFAHTSNDHIRLDKFMRDAKLEWLVNGALPFNDHRILMSYFCRADANFSTMMAMWNEFSPAEKLKFFLHGPLIAMQYPPDLREHVLGVQIRNWARWFTSFWTNPDLNMDHNFEVHSMHYLFLKAIFGEENLRAKGTFWNVYVVKNISAIISTRIDHRWVGRSGTLLSSFSRAGHRVGAISAESREYFNDEEIKTHGDEVIKRIARQQGDSFAVLDRRVSNSKLRVSAVSSSSMLSPITMFPDEPAAPSRSYSSQVVVKVSTVFTGKNQPGLLKTELFSRTARDTRHLNLWTPFDLEEVADLTKCPHYPGSQLVTPISISDLFAESATEATRQLLEVTTEPKRIRRAQAALDNIYNDPLVLHGVISRIPVGPFLERNPDIVKNRVSPVHSGFAYRLAVSNNFIESTGNSVGELMLQHSEAVAYTATDRDGSAMEAITNQKIRESLLESMVPDGDLFGLFHRANYLRIERSMIDSLEKESVSWYDTKDIATESELQERMLPEQRKKVRTKLRLELINELGLELRTWPTDARESEYLRDQIAARWLLIAGGSGLYKLSESIASERRLEYLRRSYRNRMLTPGEALYVRNDVPDTNTESVIDNDPTARNALSARYGIKRNTFPDDWHGELMFRDALLHAWSRQALKMEWEDAKRYFTEGGRRFIVMYGGKPRKLHNEPNKNYRFSCVIL